MPRNLTFQSVNGNTVVYVDPENVKNTTEFRQSLTTENYQGLRLDAHSARLVTRRRLLLKPCEDQCSLNYETAIVQTELRTSLLNSDIGLQMLSDHIRNLQHIAQRFSMGQTGDIADSGLVIDAPAVTSVEPPVA